MGKRILRMETVQKMLEVQNPESGIANLWWHGMGNSIGHDDDGTGFSTFYELYPEDNMGLIILSNTKNKSIVGGERIYDLVRYQCKKY
jgi:hypothetical protein